MIYNTITTKYLLQLKGKDHFHFEPFQAAPAFPPVPTVDSIHLQQRKASISQSKLAEESPHHLTHHQGHHPAHTEEASETAQSGGDDM